jgi:hypothetical protein
MIIIDEVLGKNIKSSKLVLLADTKDEVPETGAATAPLIPNFKNALEPGSIVWTASFEVAVLDSEDNWSWK